MRPPAATTRWHGITNGNGLSRIALPAARAGAWPAGQIGELAVGHRLAPADLASEGLQRDAAEAVDAFEVERDVEGVPLAREPVVELAGDRAVGCARLAFGLVVTRQADLAQAALGHDDGDLAERARLAPQLHGATSGELRAQLR